MTDQLSARLTLVARPQEGTQWGHVQLTQAGTEALVRLLKPLYGSEDPTIRDMAIGVVEMLDLAGIDTRAL